MPTMFITASAARHLARAYDDEMTIATATETLRQSALDATLIDERTDEGDYLYRVEDLGGRLIVRDGDPDYGLVAVAFIRDRRRKIDQSLVNAAKANILSALSLARESDVQHEARRQLRDERRAAIEKEQEEQAVARRQAAAQRAQKEADRLEAVRVAREQKAEEARAESEKKRQEKTDRLRLKMRIPPDVEALPLERFLRGGPEEYADNNLRNAASFEFSSVKSALRFALRVIERRPDDAELSKAAAFARKKVPSGYLENLENSVADSFDDRDKLNNGGPA